MSIIDFKTSLEIFDHVPMATAVLNAKNFRLDYANSAVLDIWGRDTSVLGDPLLDFMPELSSQTYPDYLEDVLTTGRPWKEEGASVLIKRFGKDERVFLDYSYTPINTGTKNSRSILIMASDATERELMK